MLTWIILGLKTKLTKYLTANVKQFGIENFFECFNDEIRKPSIPWFEKACNVSVARNQLMMLDSLWLVLLSEFLFDVKVHFK